ncbi:hypothetical protein GCM10025874_06190 [Arenivirga flava]|uniref:Uncharacterized protein n=1 Tax=Arenivirga flava TaxID=1930060 RepID=A0AA37ULS9_9MICO|nr:hypothetical protein GCM10025874_06190 [Arenivirga flava]
MRPSGPVSSAGATLQLAALVVPAVVAAGGVLVVLAVVVVAADADAGASAIGAIAIAAAAARAPRCRMIMVRIPFVVRCAVVAHLLVLVESRTSVASERDEATEVRNSTRWERCGGGEEKGRDARRAGVPGAEAVAWGARQPGCEAGRGIEQLEVPGPARPAVRGGPGGPPRGGRQSCANRVTVMVLP